LRIYTGGGRRFRAGRPVVPYFFRAASAFASAGYFAANAVQLLPVFVRWAVSFARVV
jgi:hypothetical protein